MTTISARGTALLLIDVELRTDVTGSGRTAQPPGSWRTSTQWDLMRTNMTDSHERSLLDALMDSWDRNNTILINLLRALPDVGMDARATNGSPTVAQLFAHIHFVRLVFVAEDAPEFSRPLPTDEWTAERDHDRLVEVLNEGANVVRNAVTARLQAGRDMDMHYDHPILMIQHMIWHDGYHHGQIKLALKAAGCPLNDKEIGRVTWGVWMRKTNDP
jgi:uncharacterized damage-inducible protein DinB